MIVCVSLPRFSLLAALGDRRRLAEEAVVLGPEPGREQVIGEVSPRAETFGVAAGMRVGEALSRCPELKLVPPDPEGVRALWEDVLERIETIGAVPEPAHPGVAFFDADGLYGIHGGLRGVLEATRRELGHPARLGVAPSRFAAWCAASEASQRRPTLTVDERRLRRFLAPLPVSLLEVRPQLEGVPQLLERLGVRTLGALAALPAPALVERFGHPGLLARELAHGRDLPLQPRTPPEPVSEQIELPEGVSGEQLERTLELLIARMLARRERRGRGLRAVALSARFVAGGTWRSEATLRYASADPERLRLVLAPRLAELPAPAESLTLAVAAFGPPAREQTRMLDGGATERRGRLAEAVRQARQAAGENAALRVLAVDPASRVPERRAVFAPYPDP